MYARALMFLLAAGLAGCGYKAPLYIPKPAADGRKPATVVAPEPAPDRPVPAQSAPHPK
jgi:predicted small lipoprotein YifL